jgi:phage protein D/phage baseplate assembly protein gpV
MSRSEMLPKLALELCGATLERSLALSLCSVQVVQRLSLPALCELTFSMPPNGLHDTRGFVPGAAIRVGIDGAQLFAGEITGVTHRYAPDNRHEILVRAYDPLHRLRKRRPIRAHVERTLGELARELVADLRLRVSLEDDGPSWQRLMQWRQSDLELLGEAASRCGMYFRVRADELEFVTLEGAGEALRLEAGRSLLEACFDGSAERACRAVDLRGWSSSETTQHEASIAEPRIGRRVSFDALGPFEERVDTRTLVDELTQSDSHAAALAQAELDWHTAGEIVVRGVAEGNADLCPGACIEIEGVASMFEGRYVATEVVHRVDREQGFRSEFDTAPPRQTARPRGAITTIGRVIDVADPHDLGRVRVSLPSYCDIETDWLAVVLQGAGPAKGMACLPDVGDRVLLIVPREDLAQALVVGGLYGNEAPRDPGVRGGRVRCYTLVLPGGQRLFLDGEKKKVRLENGGGNDLELAPGRARIANSSGSFLELTSDRVRIHANADLELEAPGKSVIVRGARVDFQTG